MSAKTRVLRLEKEIGSGECLYPPYGFETEPLEETERFLEAVIHGDKTLKKYLASQPKQENCKCSRCKRSGEAINDWLKECSK